MEGGGTGRGTDRVVVVVVVGGGVVLVVVVGMWGGITFPSTATMGSVLTENRGVV